MVNDVLRLPGFPSTSARKKLSPSQRSSLYQTIASTLSIVVSLPQEKRDTASTRHYLSTYAKDSAFQTLQTLIWGANSQDTANRSANEKSVHKLSLVLAQKLALSKEGIDLQTLLDLSIVYARIHPKPLQTVFTNASQASLSSQTLSTDLIPTFTALLSQRTSEATQGLYAQRKVAECIYAFLVGCSSSSRDLLRPFARNKPFILALAQAYDAGLSTIAVPYGGTPALLSATQQSSSSTVETDDWERIWVETKVTFLDSFHILLSALLSDLAGASHGVQLAAEAERTFDIIFALLELPPSASTTNATSAAPPTPFLNQSLLADYQHSYSLSSTLGSALKHASEKDARLDVLESTLRSFEENIPPSEEGNSSQNKNPGALKILLRSSGIQPGISNLGVRTTSSHTFTTQATQGQDKGKSRAPPLHSDAPDPDLPLKTSQILDILPDLAPSYIHLLLSSPKYKGDVESVLAALLEGRAEDEEELLAMEGATSGGEVHGDWDGVDGDVTSKGKERATNWEERRNVFDDEALDVSRLRVGKKGLGTDVLKDRTYIEQMKADILRWAEAMSDEEEEDEYDPFAESTTATNLKGKSKAKPKSTPTVLGPDDIETESPAVRIAGDGEDTDDEDSDSNSSADEEAEETPENLIELAYLRDPSLFDRDSATRRSKAREDLRSRTGWADEQIEGWKVMLERTPNRKAKLMEKHAFRGNEKGLDLSSSTGGPNRGRGRGGGNARGRAGGRGRGGGGPSRGGQGGGGGGADNAKERAWKDKNKASRGNHNRKRGHDKKMARAGPPPT